jgi:hypothetical protein
MNARKLYRTTASNLKSGFNRTNKGSPSLTLGIDEFVKWRRATEQKCHYCGIDEPDVRRVGMKSQVQRDMSVMGVDRLDSSKGYEEGNLVPCCFVCNQIKGDRFSDAEMEKIGPAVAEVWHSRLALLPED